MQPTQVNLDAFPICRGATWTLAGRLTLDLTGYKLRFVFAASEGDQDAATAIDSDTLGGVTVTVAVDRSYSDFVATLTAAQTADIATGRTSGYYWATPIDPSGNALPGWHGTVPVQPWRPDGGAL